MIPRFKPYLGWPELSTLFRSNKGAVELFEKEFAQAFGAVDAVAFPYGRSAQWAFFKAMGLENAEIIMPAYTCSVVAHAISLSGNTPSFIDIDLNDYNMNLDLLRSAINEKTRAVIATHTFGYPQDVETLGQVVEEAQAKYGHKIWIMQDCCHAFGAAFKGRPVSEAGDVAVYAFNISKLMTSIFGGMLTFQDKGLADRVRQWRDHNFNRAGSLKQVVRRLYMFAVFIAFNEKFYAFTWWLQSRTKFLDRITKKYHLDEKIHFPPDYMDFMVDVEAAVGLKQLIRYPEIIAQRYANVQWYHRNLPKKTDWIFPPIIEGATYSHYVIRVPDRKLVVDEWLGRGIHLGELIQYSIPSTRAYTTNLGCDDNSLLASRVTVNFPIYPELKTSDLISMGLGEKRTVELLSKLHYDALSDEDFSKVLGLEAIELFYSLLLQNKYGRVFYDISDGVVVSVCSVFYDYQRFRQHYMAKSFFIIAKAVAGNPRILGLIFGQLQDEYPKSLEACKSFHLGMIIRNKAFSDQKVAVRSFKENYTMGLRYLSLHGATHVWGSTLKTNSATVKFLLRNDYIKVHETDRVAYFRREL